MDALGVAPLDVQCEKEDYSDSGKISCHWPWHGWPSICAGRH